MCLTLYTVTRNAFQNAEECCVVAICILLYLIYILSVCGSKLSSINSPRMEVKYKPRKCSRNYRESVVEIPTKFPNFLVLNKLSSPFGKLEAK